MINLNDFITREILRKTPRFKGETTKIKEYKCNCPSCNNDIGYITKSRYKSIKSCKSCSIVNKLRIEKFKENHWVKLGLLPHNKGSTTDEQRLKNKIRGNLRSRLYVAIKGNFKSGSAVSDLGCSIEEFKSHLEKQFFDNPRTGERMTWDNHTLSGWHIDHILPLDSFDLTSREETIIACHYSNLRPLWAKENIIKSNKLLSDTIVEITK